MGKAKGIAARRPSVERCASGLTVDTSAGSKPTGGPRRPLRILARGAAVLLLGLSPLLNAQLLENLVTPLEALDRQYMDLQRQRINELTLRYYGGRCCRMETELDYLQRLLDDRYVAAEQTLELQAMGVLLGDLLVSELDLRWVVYEDAKGRSRALQIDDSDNYLFPVTMISRRWEVGDRMSVADIYANAVAAVESARPPLPFEEPR